MTALHDHLLAAAVEAGEVPADVAEWVDAGARPDPPELAHLTDDEIDTVARRAHRWQIHSIGGATWAMRLYAAAKQAEEQNVAWHAEERKRLDAWLSKANEAHRNTCAFAEDHLGRWALALREANPKQATFTTPAGKVETRWPSKPWTVEVADKQALLEWALANQRDDLLRPTLAPVTEVRKAVALGGDAEAPLVVDPATGEVVPGLTVEPTRPTVTVRPAATE